MHVSSFFAGIGGFDLSLERGGMKVVFQCELDPFCQQILKRHWPQVPLHDDITTLNPATIANSSKIPVIPACDLRKFIPNYRFPLSASTKIIEPSVN
jgi:site-specific DNA-cytosine methylase